MPQRRQAKRVFALSMRIDISISVDHDGHLGTVYRDPHLRGSTHRVNPPHIARRRKRVYDEVTVSARRTNRLRSLSPTPASPRRHRP